MHWVRLDVAVPISQELEDHIAHLHLPVERRIRFHLGELAASFVKHNPERARGKLDQARCAERMLRNSFSRIEGATGASGR